MCGYKYISPQLTFQHVGWGANPQCSQKPMYNLQLALCTRLLRNSNSTSVYSTNDRSCSTIIFIERNLHLSQLMHFKLMLFKGQLYTYNAFYESYKFTIYKNIYTYVCIYIYTHICIHIHICVYIYIYIYIYNFVLLKSNPNPTSQS